ncbi:hypothetical protein M422DRAFT_784973 [Sphaerobolus stellatus SS14]|uniref:Uncharacterized protein n=1 Tax=Sphaerobolus stellatus (strain SS14) TaxID=990650 RepID=A0A0C9UDU9_SPHS4|nr:hypothetical protein M422DRAFT_784973 [Sphaerobolus stellatus SS14]
MSFNRERSAPTNSKSKLKEMVPTFSGPSRATTALRFTSPLVHYYPDEVIGLQDRATSLQNGETSLQNEETHVIKAIMKDNNSEDSDSDDPLLLHN